MSTRNQFVLLDYKQIRMACSLNYIAHEIVPHEWAGEYTGNALGALVAWPLREQLTTTLHN